MDIPTDKSLKLNSITIDSSSAITDLCKLGAMTQTDKSPYNKVTHRHPYTGVYALLFSRFQYQPIQFAEIGIAGGASILMWSFFFKHEDTKIFAFDRDSDFVQNVRNYNLPNVVAGMMDVYDEETIRFGLSSSEKQFDVILDDSIHELTAQLKIIHTALPFLKPGGMIIIEDVFRQAPEEDYRAGIADILDQFSYVSFIQTEHKDRYSPGWDNDKLLVLIKK